MLDTIANEKTSYTLQRQGSLHKNGHQTKNWKNTNTTAQHTNTNNPDERAEFSKKRDTHNRNSARPPPSTLPPPGYHDNVQDVRSLFVETMQDISVAATSTLATLQSLRTTTGPKKRGANNATAAARTSKGTTTAAAPLGCVSVAVPGSQQQHSPNPEEDVLSPSSFSPTATPTEKQQQQVSSSSKLSSSLALIRSNSGTDALKRMSAVFQKVMVDGTNNLRTNNNNNNNTTDDVDGADNNNMQRRHDHDNSNGDEGNDDHRNNINNTNANAGWGVGQLLANGLGWDDDDDEEEEQQSVGSYDTWDDENSTLRRLGSWGTVNTQETNGTMNTFGTLGTIETVGTGDLSLVGGGPVSTALALATAKEHDGTTAPRNGEVLQPGVSAILAAAAAAAAAAADSSSGGGKYPKQILYDDSGNAIDPLLIEVAIKKQQQQQQQQQREGGHAAGTAISADPRGTKKKKERRRRRRRKKVVRFDYPPIKSLRQYVRPDPEDLPNLFFTEEELDQIEDDRYNTMSTDDIEIVAVSSKEQTIQQQHEQHPETLSPSMVEDSGRRQNGKMVGFSSSSKAPPSAHIPGLKSVKGRSGTPNRRRNVDISLTNGEDTPVITAGTTTTRAVGSQNNRPTPINTAVGDDGRTGNVTSSSSSPRRLVKGVQIYLRERSTGNIASPKT